MRFGLLNLLIGVVFLSGLLGCWLMPGPWMEWKKIPSDGSTILDVTLSVEHNYLATLNDDADVRLYSYPELKLLWSGPSASWIQIPKHIRFMGNPTMGVRAFASNFITEVQSVYLDIKDGSYLAEDLQSGEARSAAFDSYRKKEYHSWFFTEDGIEYTHTLGSTTPEALNDDGTTPNIKFDTLYRRRYPSGWYGHLYRPEVWVTILAGLALMIQFFRRRRVLVLTQR